MSFFTNQSQRQAYNGPPQVPPPWLAEWDARDNRWFYINRETGERTFDYPQQAYGGSNYGSGYSQDYGGQAQREYYDQEPPKKSHTGRNVALGAAAGLVGGALLMHEGQKVGKYSRGHSYKTLSCPLALCVEN